jgi:hypothetical protein
VAGRRLGDVFVPTGHLPVSVLHNRTLREPDPAIRLRPGDQVNVLVPTPPDGPHPCTGNNRLGSGRPGGLDEPLRVSISR